MAYLDLASGLCLGQPVMLARQVLVDRAWSYRMPLTD
jgi:hypothetical protein